MSNLEMNDLEKLHATMRHCQLCLDAGHDIVPGAVIRGNITAKAMLIGQAPGITEVQVKRPFNAGSGKRLFKWLQDAEWDEDDFRDNQYMTAVTKCYPGRHPNGKGDRVPSRPEQALCRPFLETEIRLVKPKLMLLVGKLSIQLLFPKKLKLTEMIGTAVYFPPEALTDPVQFDFGRGESVAHYRGETDGRYVVPIPHPSGASLWPNKPENKALILNAMHLIRDIRNGMIRADDSILHSK